MNTRTRQRRAGGYVSYVLVVSLAVTLTLLMLAAYRSALASQKTGSISQLKADYGDRESAILRAVINIAPNRAMRAMQSGSNATATTRNPLRWQNIFEDALGQANARTAADATLLASLGLSGAVSANPGNSAFAYSNLAIDAIEPETGYVAPGIDRSLGAGFPPPLSTADSTTASRDRTYPIIGSQKYYGSLASGLVGLPVTDYPQFNLIAYPEIRFGYGTPGQPFVAKRNWWAFSLSLADHDDPLTGLPKFERDFILSIYEIPSQLAISAATFANVGMHADGTPWQNASINGGVFSSRVEVQGGVAFDRLAGRRGVAVGSEALIGGDSFANNPFQPGVRESFELENNRFLPVYLSSEAGRSAFIPINRGADFFDRFRHTAESNTVSLTPWNQYTVGALQCAMRLDVIDVDSAANQLPTMLRFGYLAGGLRQSMDIPLVVPQAGLPAGYVKCCNEHETVTFPEPVDVAYGVNGCFAFQSGVSGSVTFENARFGDPLVGTLKAGYFRPSYPFEVVTLHEVKPCIVVYPQRFPRFLRSISASGPEVNHSIVVNADYLSNTDIRQPSFPALDGDIGVILKECADLTAFTKGFSAVTNMRLYIGDNFNVVETTPPAGSGLAAPFYPPASLFAPERRYGTEVDPWRVVLDGQLGSMASDEADGSPTRLLDLKLASEQDASHDRVVANLRPIQHPAALPPVNMMNWLVVIQERRREFYAAN